MSSENIVMYSLSLRDEQSLRAMGVRECPYVAYPCIGVFKNEYDFIKYLTSDHEFHRGITPCNYAGIKHKGQCDLPISVKITTENKLEDVMEVIRALRMGDPAQNTLYPHTEIRSAVRQIIGDGYEININIAKKV